jgi:hypothetical protein
MRTAERYGNIIQPVVDITTRLKAANWEMQSIRLLDPANPVIGPHNCHQTRRAKDPGGRTNDLPALSRLHAPKKGVLFHVSVLVSCPEGMIRARNWRDPPSDYFWAVIARRRLAPTALTHGPALGSATQDSRPQFLMLHAAS